MIALWLMLMSLDSALKGFFYTNALQEKVKIQLFSGVLLWHASTTGCNGLAEGPGLGDCFLTLKILYRKFLNQFFISYSDVTIWTIRIFFLPFPPSFPSSLSPFLPQRPPTAKNFPSIAEIRLPVSQFSHLKSRNNNHASNLSCYEY